ncbi:hypothetical protein FA13DRAFT_1599203, partial [Coprinellus micaceus]
KTSSKKKGANKENTSPDAVKTPAERCHWPDVDNIILLGRLKAEKAGGNQSESGWKKTVWIGCATDLAKDGVSKLPVKTWEKCRDHFTNLKKEFSDFKELLGSGLSGFGWDDATKRVIATDEVWDAKIKANKRFKVWKEKIYLIHDDMFYLVDGVVATGAGAFNPGQTPPSSPPRAPTVSPPSE